MPDSGLPLRPGESFVTSVSEDWAETRRLNAWIVRDALLEAYGARDLHPRNEPIFDALDALEKS